MNISPNIQINFRSLPPAQTQKDPAKKTHFQIKSTSWGNREANKLVWISLLTKECSNVTCMQRFAINFFAAASLCWLCGCFYFISHMVGFVDDGRLFGWRVELVDFYFKVEKIEKFGKFAIQWRHLRTIPINIFYLLQLNVIIIRNREKSWQEINMTT